MDRWTFRDAWIGAGFGVCLGLGPLTSTHRSASLVGGVCIAIGVFAFRRWRRKRAQERGETYDRIVLARPSGAAWLALVLFAAVFAPTLAWMLERWIDSIFHNAYGLLVPLAMAVLAHATLARDPDARDEASPWGFAFLGVGLGLAILDSGLQTHQLSVLGLITCLPGLSLLWLGARRTRALALPLALGLFLIPLPNLPASPLGLREATAGGAERILSAIDVPIALNRTLLTLASGERYLVTDNCSGFQLVPAGLALALVLASGARTRARAALLLLAAIPIAILANLVRTAVLLAMSHFIGSDFIHVTFIHGSTGIIAFCGLVAALVALAGPSGVRQAFA